MSLGTSVCLALRVLIHNAQFGRPADVESNPFGELRHLCD
jgi:hypothetical protein